MAEDPHDAIVDVIDASKRRVLDVGELWRYRELFYFFTWRDVKIRYKQTVLGFLWAVLQPLLMMSVVTYSLSRFVDVSSTGLVYPVFVFTGLLIWNIFSTGLTAAGNSMISNALIIKKIYFPRLVIPVSSILVALFDFAMASIILVPLLWYFHQPVGWGALWAWPAAVALAAVATLGIGSWVAALNVKYRDFRYVIPFAIQMLFFASPILYPIGGHDGWIQYVIASSPVYAAIELFRAPLLDATPNLTLMGISLGSNVLLLVIGVWYFARTEGSFSDYA